MTVTLHTVTPGLTTSTEYRTVREAKAAAQAAAGERLTWEHDGESYEGHTQAALALLTATGNYPARYWQVTRG